MAIRTAIGLWIPRSLVAPSQLASTVGAGLPALVVQRVPVVVHRLLKPEATFVTAHLDALGEFHPYLTQPNLMDPLAAALAKILEVRVFSLFAMAGAVDFLRIGSFYDTGAPLWAEMDDSGEPLVRMSRELALPRRKYFALDVKALFEPRGGGWKKVGEVKPFVPDPGDLPPELLQTGDYELFDPLPKTLAKKKPKKKPRVGVAVQAQKQIGAKGIGDFGAATVLDGFALGGFR